MKKSLTDIKGFLVDLDGTTYISDTPTPGSVQFFNRLHKRGIPYFFFSNNPTKNSGEHMAHLLSLNITATEQNIITSADATVEYLTNNQLTTIYAIGTPSFEHHLRSQGITLTHQNPQAVVISFDTTLTYDKLKTASLLLHNNPNIPYIATNPDPVCAPTVEGPIPDCGAIAAFLQASTGRMPLVIGKPGHGMLDIACKRMNASPQDFAIIGDHFATDMQMGFDHGVTTILVLCGDSTHSDVDNAPQKPDYVVADLAELTTLLT